MKRGVLITIFGMDGSGKTTVLKRLQTTFQSEYSAVARYHLRPSFGRPAKDGVGAPPAHDQPPRGMIMSSAKAAFFAFDFLIARLGLLARHKRAGDAVLFDRYMHDLLADPLRYRYGGSMILWRLACWAAPKPDLMILLDVPAPVAVARKGELTLARADELRQRYLELATVFGWLILDATKPPEMLVEEIVEKLNATQKS